MGAVGRRHEIDDRRTASLSLEFGFEDQCAGTISPPHGERRILWSDEPSAVVGCPEQGGKARSRIETGPAQPVDRAVAATWTFMAVSPFQVSGPWRQDHRA